MLIDVQQPLQQQPTQAIKLSKIPTSTFFSGVLSETTVQQYIKVSSTSRAEMEKVMNMDGEILIYNNAAVVESYKLYKYHIQIED